MAYIGMRGNMKLIIQIPCYNEAETLGITLRDLPKKIEGIDQIEVLIVDDGSSDDTSRVARDCGVDYIVRFRRNKGLAKGFMAGIDACLRNGADIIVNTDADNQYVGKDIEKLIRPIIDGKASIVIGERPIDEIEHFSPLKKKLQHLGSWVVRKASDTDIPDAPSGFRAYSREAAMRLNVINDYTYTLETIVQAGRNKNAMISVPIRTNDELRESRLFSSMKSYIKKSMLTILRSFTMYKPLFVFSVIAFIFSAIGIGVGVRFLMFYFKGYGNGHTQSLILSAMLIIIGVLCFMIGLLGDVIAGNRKILEDIQLNVRQIKYDYLDSCNKKSDRAEDVVNQMKDSSGA